MYKPFSIPLGRSIVAEETPDAIDEERAEDAGSKFQRECMDLLTQANRLAAFQPDRVVEICMEVSKRVRDAIQRNWPGVETIHAMQALLIANQRAYLHNGSDAEFWQIVRAYAGAIHNAKQHAYDPLYHLRAKRAFAGMLAYHGTAAQARIYLRRIFTAMKPDGDGGTDYHRELREQYEDLWVQTVTQLAEVEWLLGDSQEAHQLLDSIAYPANIHMHHVAAVILHARLCWHTGQRKRGAGLARQAARDIERVAIDCHPGSVRRARLLRWPLLRGIERYERAYKEELCCPHI